MSDEFQDRKGIHIKLDKNVHHALRVRLFKEGISMQEMFDEFARQVVTDSNLANKIVKSLINKKMLKALEGPVMTQKRRTDSFNELDSDRLYDMIDEASSKKEKIDENC